MTYIPRQSVTAGDITVTHISDITQVVATDISVANLASIHPNAGTLTAGIYSGSLSSATGSYAGNIVSGVSTKISFVNSVGAETGTITSYSTGISDGILMDGVGADIKIFGNVAAGVFGWVNINGDVVSVNGVDISDMSIGAVAGIGPLSGYRLLMVPNV